MQVTFQEVVGGARELLCAFAHAHANVSKFSLCKKSQKNSPTACIGEIGENFLLAKIPTYTVFKLVYSACMVDYWYHSNNTLHYKLIFVVSGSIYSWLDYGGANSITPYA